MSPALGGGAKQGLLSLARACKPSSFCVFGVVAAAAALSLLCPSTPFAAHPPPPRTCHYQDPLLAPPRGGWAQSARQQRWSQRWRQRRRARLAAPARAHDGAAPRKSHRHATQTPHTHTKPNKITKHKTYKPQHTRVHNTHSAHHFAHTTHYTHPHTHTLSCWRHARAAQAAQPPAHAHAHKRARGGGGAAALPLHHLGLHPNFFALLEESIEGRSWKKRASFFWWSNPRFYVQFSFLRAF